MNLQMQALEKVSENIYLLAGAVSSLAVLITYYLFNVAKVLPLDIYFTFIHEYLNGTKRSFSVSNNFLSNYM